MGVETIEVRPCDGKAWDIRSERSPKPTLGAGEEMRLNLTTTAPVDARLTKPYFSRPNQEQPYYDLDGPPVSEPFICTVSLNIGHCAPHLSWG